MKKIISVLLVAILSMAMVFSAVDFSKVDEAYWHEEYSNLKADLEKMLSTTKDPKDLSGIYWRLSRLYVALGDQIDESKKNERMAVYEEGEALADKSLEAFETPDGYLWKCSNIGRQGQVKGPLNSLSKASGMRELLETMVDKFEFIDSSEAWYVLGCLYDQLPGGISFGDQNKAVSCMRLAVETIPKTAWYGGTYKYLAQVLLDRNWDVAKRTKEFPKIQKKYEKEKKSYCKSLCYYEGKIGLDYVPFYTTTAVGRMTDKQEAKVILQYALNVYKARPFHTPSDEKNYKELTEMLASIK